MTPIIPGDLVTFSGHPWAVLDNDLPSVSGFPPDIRIVLPSRVGDNFISAKQVSPEAVELLIRPSFEAGMKLRLWGEPCEVVSRPSVYAVRVRQFHRVELSTGDHRSWTGEANVPAGLLAVENIPALLRLEALFV